MKNSLLEKRIKRIKINKDELKMNNFEIAVEIIKNNHERCLFAGKKDRSLIGKAENFLDIKLPREYTEFLIEFGSCCIESTEIYGIFDDNFTNSSAPDAIWSTYSLRNDFNLIKNMVVIESIGDGDFILLNCEEGDGNNYLIRYSPGSPQPYCERLYDSFGDYLLSVAKNLIT